MPTPSLVLIIKQSVNWKTTHTEILRTGLKKKKSTLDWRVQIE